jgi:hypothetical protein
VIDDRVYTTICLDGQKTIDLRFHVDTDKKEFLENLNIAFNCSGILFPEAEWELSAETPGHDIIMNRAISMLRKGGFTNYYHTGVLHQQKEIKITDLGRTSYVLYMHIDGPTLEMIEVFPTHEEALLKMLEWRAKETNEEWCFTRKDNRRITYDAVIWDFLHSIDSIEEMIKYKVLYEDQLEYLLQKGLVSVSKSQV